MGFSLMAWNVRHFFGAPQRTRDVARWVRRLDADVIGFCELASRVAARALMAELDEYDFGVTDGVGQLELLLGWRRRRFAQVLFTQRREFRNGQQHLRPGALLSLRVRPRTFYHVLLLHADAGSTPHDYQNRQALVGKIWSLQRALASLPRQRGLARLVVIGDLNVVGDGNGVSARAELEALADAARARGMRLCRKDAPYTWHPPSARGVPADLDHVLASDEVRLRRLDGAAAVRVVGWNELAGARRAAFLRELSDHAALYCEVSR
ncbi:MAG: endonuclease/exonuclease/phosphatase family protein [Myxococcales bacterium]|nr:endonuclease/exonuclease/phosphatase family protein [Myxococcales bacterium]